LRPWGERLGLRLWAWAAARPGIYSLLTRIGARIGKLAGGRDRLLHRLPPGASGWTDGRDLPAPEGRTFRELYASGAITRKGEQA
jgi:L-lactate dehydrogenase complex protein LldF